MTCDEYYYASTNEEISNLSTEIVAARAKDIDMTDSDEDGLPDVFEIAGMQVQDGTVIYTDPTETSSDNDDLDDGEEIILNYNKVTGTVSFTMFSDPNLEDTDGDGIWDDEDENPKDPISVEELGIKEFFENAEFFEILFVLENPWLQELGIQKEIKCVEICREYCGSTDWDAIHEKFYEAEIVQAPDPDRPWYEKFLDSISYMDPAETLLAEVVLN